MLKKAQNVDNVYYYSFDVVDPFQNSIAAAPISAACVTRSCHTIELWYLWLPPFFVNNGLIVPNTFVIGQEMQTFWSNWAKNLDPNNVNDDTWPVYSNTGNSKKEFLSFQGVANIDYVTDSFHDDEEECQFWDTMGYAGTYPAED
eukprot:131183_1